TLADVPVSPMGEGGDGGAPQLNPQAEAIATSTGRQNVDGGAPRGGSPSDVGEPESGAGSPAAELVSSVTVARAEASDAPAGPAEIGGGTTAPARSTSGPTLAASTQAEFVEIAGAPASGGADNGSPLEA